MSLLDLAAHSVHLNGAWVPRLGPGALGLTVPLANLELWGVLAPLWDPLVLAIPPDGKLWVPPLWPSVSSNYGD